MSEYSCTFEYARAERNESNNNNSRKYRSNYNKCKKIISYIRLL